MRKLLLFFEGGGGGGEGLVFGFSGEGGEAACGRGEDAHVAEVGEAAGEHCGSGGREWDVRINFGNGWDFANSMQGATLTKPDGKGSAVVGGVGDCHSGDCEMSPWERDGADRNLGLARN